MEVDKHYSGVQQVRNSFYRETTGMSKGSQPGACKRCPALWRNSPSALVLPTMRPTWGRRAATLSLSASARCVIACLYS